MTSRTLLRMNEANIYHKYHGMQDRDANLALTRYIPKLQLDKKLKILDIGCGPGDLTYKYLLPLIPKNGSMLGVDISQKMIQYANTNYKDSRLAFQVMDITNLAIGDQYECTFDSIFSFYCLHWIQDQKSAMKNISKILKPGGECLLIFLATSPIYKLYETLAYSKRWYPFMKDFKNAISPYHYSADPVGDIKKLTDEVGLQIKDCFCTPTTYSIPSEETLYKSIEAVNPFIDYIPDHLLQDYFEDCKSIIWKEKLCYLEPTKTVTVPYSLMTLYAYKSFK